MSPRAENRGRVQGLPIVEYLLAQARQVREVERQAGYSMMRPANAKGFAHADPKGAAAARRAKRKAEKAARRRQKGR